MDIKGGARMKRILDFYGFTIKKRKTKGGGVTYGLCYKEPDEWGNYYFIVKNLPFYAIKSLLLSNFRLARIIRRKYGYTPAWDKTDKIIRSLQWWAEPLSPPKKEDIIAPMHRCGIFYCDIIRYRHPVISEEVMKDER